MWGRGPSGGTLPAPSQAMKPQLEAQMREKCATPAAMPHAALSLRLSKKTNCQPPVHSNLPPASNCGWSSANLRRLMPTAAG